ncbi:MAG: O-antigen polysaccharide polymerase Wzy, partial [Anaerolineae bacterium]
QFSMPVYTQPNWLISYNRQVPIRWATVFEVLLFAELGVAAMILSYFLARRSPLARHLPRLDLPMMPDRRSLYLLGALAGGGLLTLLQVLSWGFLGSATYAALVRLVSSQFNVAVVLLAYVVYGKREQSLFASVGLYAAVVFGFIVGLMTGMLENTLMPLVLLLAVRWHATRRIPWLAIVFGLVLYLVLNPAKFQYRQQVWFGGQEYGFSQRLEVWALAVDEELATTRQQAAWEETIRDSLARFDLVHRFAYVREMTPAYIPYYHGESYAYFLYAWVPRLLWPGKPSASEALDRLDLDYSLKHESQPVSIGIGQLPEAYANFGVVGMILVMAFQGTVFALLDAVLNGRRSEGGRAIYLVIMAYFLNGIGSSAAVLFGALVQYILASAILLRPFATAWQSKGEIIGHKEADSDPPGTGHGVGVEEAYL